jgi:5'-nucleotidase
MKIVLTNDDGFDAPGISALVDALASVGDLWIVAPDRAQSGIGHQVTTHAPIQIEAGDGARYRVHGTPADCVRIALKVLCPDADWVISGINPGANLGSDVFQSGTVAAAREAAILGCRAIAISQYIAKDTTVLWPVTTVFAKTALRMLITESITCGHFFNVNLPHRLSAHPVPECAYCVLDPHPHRYTYLRSGDRLFYAGSIHERPRDPGKDVDVCFNGRIAITRLSVTGELPAS